MTATASYIRLHNIVYRKVLLPKKSLQTAAIVTKLNKFPRGKTSFRVSEECESQTQ